MDGTNLIPLGQLATQINAEHQAAEDSARSAVQHAIRCGELLEQAKARVKHGQWLPWLREHFQGAERTAQAYMRLASNPQRVADMDSIRGALEHLSVRRDPKPEPPGYGAKREHLQAHTELMTARVSCIHARHPNIVLPESSCERPESYEDWTLDENFDPHLALHTVSYTAYWLATLGRAIRDQADAALQELAAIPETEFSKFRKKKLQRKWWQRYHQGTELWMDWSEEADAVPRAPECDTLDAALREVQS